MGLKFLANLSVRSVILILIILGALVYGRVLTFPFVHDDVVFIVNNPHISELNLNSILTYTAFPNQDYPQINAYYRPLLEFIYRLEYKIFQFNPWGYHLTNVLVHGFNSLLVFFIIKHLLGNNQWLGLAGALLFFLHRDLFSVVPPEFQVAV